MKEYQRYQVGKRKEMGVRSLLPFFNSELVLVLSRLSFRAATVKAGNSTCAGPNLRI